MNCHWSNIAVALGNIAFCAAGFGQAPPVTILEIDMENVVNYVDDLADPSKKATSPAMSPIPSLFMYAFRMNITLADIVAVNGKPAKGLHVQQFGPRVFGTTQFTPGRSIADLDGGCQLQAGFMILKPDGTPVGTIMATGTASPSSPPGAPTSATAFNLAVVGGTGAFLGARGQTSRSLAAVATRTTSMIEDPAYRRLNGGGKQRYVVHLTSANWPEVTSTASGPAIFHVTDFSLVTAGNPARAGEWLTLRASGLGPTAPGVDPGKPFPPLEEGRANRVISPVEVTVGGKATEIYNVIGWPGQTNAYRVDFQIPDGTPAGLTPVVLAAAWITGPEVKIPVR